MESEPTGDYIAIVVRLRAAAEGMWYIDIAGTHSAQAIPLVPMTLVVRLWRASNTKLLRGIVRLHGTDHWAPIHSNNQLVELVQAWLLSSDNTAGSQ